MEIKRDKCEMEKLYGMGWCANGSDKDWKRWRGTTNIKRVRTASVGENDSKIIFRNFTENMAPFLSLSL